jgi:hypothetical protein
MSNGAYWGRPCNPRPTEGIFFIRAKDAAEALRATTTPTFSEPGESTGCG